MMTKSFHSMAQMKYWKISHQNHAVLSSSNGNSDTSTQRIQIKWNIHFIRHWKGDTMDSPAEHVLPLYATIASSLRCFCLLLLHIYHLWFTNNYLKMATIQKNWNNFFAVSVSLYPHLKHSRIIISCATSECMDFAFNTRYLIETNNEHTHNMIHSWMEIRILVHNENNGVTYFKDSLLSLA